MTHKHTIVTGKYPSNGACIAQYNHYTYSHAQKQYYPAANPNPYPFPNPNPYPNPMYGYTQQPYPNPAWGAQMTSYPSYF